MEIVHDEDSINMEREENSMNLEIFQDSQEYDEASMELEII